MKTKTIKSIDIRDWDKLVVQTYGKKYSFQQQDGCRPPGTFLLDIPSSFASDDEEEMNDEISIDVNGDEMGVKFDVWLNRIEPFFEDDFYDELFWHRNFYPSIYTLANDMHAKGLLEQGEYLINDW